MSTKDLDFFVSSGLDQTNEIDASWVIEKIDEVVAESLAERDVEIAFNAINQLRTVAKVSGLGLAKALYEISEHWDEFGIDEPFADYTFNRIGVHKFTVQRYVKIWKMFAKSIIPPEFEKQIMSINIRDQVPIANAIDSGFQFNDDEWKEIAHAPDSSSIGTIINKILKRPSRSSGIRLMVDRGGDIWAYAERYDRKWVGSLNLDSEDDVVKKAVRRITTRSGIMEQ